MCYLRRIHWAVWLGSLLIVVGGGTVFFWWESAARQRAACERISQKGHADLSHDMFFEGNFGNGQMARAVNLAEDRILQFVPLDYHWWYSVETVSLGHWEDPGLEPITDHDLDVLVELPRLKILILQGTSITRSGMQRVAGLSQLEELILNESPSVMDEDLVLLKELRQLRSLNLDWLPIKGHGLRHLQSLPHLEEVSVSRTKLDREGLKAMQSLKQVKHWKLYDVPVDERTVAIALLKFHQIETLKADLRADDRGRLQRAFPGAKINQDH